MNKTTSFLCTVGRIVLTMLAALFGVATLLGIASFFVWIRDADPASGLWFLALLALIDAAFSWGGTVWDATKPY